MIDDKEQKPEEPTNEDKGYERFLLKEYDYFANCFWRSEEIGERRLSFFVSLVTAVLAGIIVLLTNFSQTNDGLFSNTLILAVIAGLLALLLFGLFTLKRIIKRNLASDGYKKDMDRIRRKFKDEYSKLDDYNLPFKFDARKILTGGIADMLVYLNSIIIAAIFALIALQFSFSILILSVSGVVGFISSISFLFVYKVNSYYVNYFKRSNRTPPKYKSFFKNQRILSLIIIGIFCLIIYFGMLLVNLISDQVFLNYKIGELQITVVLGIIGTIWIAIFFFTKFLYNEETRRKKWEWRIFWHKQKGKNDDFDPWIIDRKGGNELKGILKKAEFDERTDFYFNIQDPRFGLKLRGRKEKDPKGEPPKLELKVRRQKIEELEYWEKCISETHYRKVNNYKELDVKNIKDYLENESDTLDPKLTKKCKKTINKIKKTLLKIRNQEKTSQTIEIEKKRRRFRAILDKSENWKFSIEKSEDPNVVIIEETEIQINLIQKQTIKLQTISVESEHLNYIKKFKERFIQVSDGLVMGYPEFIIYLRKMNNTL